MKGENNYIKINDQPEKNVSIQYISERDYYISQRFSCELLFNLLSSGEKCIHHYHKERKYRYYDPLTTAKTKNQDELELEFRNQLRCFQACFIDDIENGGFRYPDNLNRQAIIEDVKGWMKYAKMGYRDILYQTYEKFITLLEKEKQIIIEKVIIVKENNEPFIMNKGIFEGIYQHEISNFIESSIAGSNAAFEMENKIKYDYEKGEKLINAILYQDSPKQINEVTQKSIRLLKQQQHKESNKSSTCC